LPEADRHSLFRTIQIHLADGFAASDGQPYLSLSANPIMDSAFLCIKKRPDTVGEPPVTPPTAFPQPPD
jgi:hypothetical protein